MHCAPLFKLTHALLARSKLGLGAGKSAIVTNGRVIALDELQPLIAEDFQLLNQYASSAQAAKLVRNSSRECDVNHGAVYHSFEQPTLSFAAVYRTAA